MASVESKIRRMGCLAAAALVLCPEISRADESGISFWLPGLEGSLAATPTTPGWSLGTIYYHTSVNASGAAAAAREFQVGRFSPTVNINLNLNLSGQADLLFVAPTYTFATPLFGGQASMTLAGVYGRNSASLAGTLTATAGPIVTTRTGFLEDALTSYGDLYPTFKLKWNNGVNNYMVYAAGDIPVGDYNPNRLANIGIGHGAIDLGGGYTYLNPTTGTEFSGVGGFTYNFKNPDTIPKRHRFPFRLGRIAVHVEAGLCRLRRLCLSADHRRLRPAGRSRRLPFARSRHRPADWIYFSDRG